MPTPALLFAAAALAYFVLTPGGRQTLSRTILGQTAPTSSGGQTDVGAIAGAVGAVANTVTAGLGLIKPLVEPSPEHLARVKARAEGPREDLLRQISRAAKGNYRAMARADVREWTIDSGGRISIWYFTKDSLNTKRAQDIRAQAEDVIEQFSLSKGVTDPVAQHQVVVEKKRQLVTNPDAVIAWASSLGIHPTLVRKANGGYGAQAGNTDPPDFVIPPPDSGPISKYALALAFEPVVRVTGATPQRGGRLEGDYIEFPPDEPGFHPHNPYAPPELRIDTLRRERELAEAAAATAAQQQPGG